MVKGVRALIMRKWVELLNARDSSSLSLFCGNRVRLVLNVTRK